MIGLNQQSLGDKKHCHLRCLLSAVINLRKNYSSYVDSKISLALMTSLLFSLQGRM